MKRLRLILKRFVVGDVDENDDFTSLDKCGRRFLCLGKRD
jgi:hypothetical protein